MRPANLLAYPPTTICLILLASAQSRPFDSIRNAFLAIGDQTPLGDRLHKIMPPSQESVSTGVIISDVIGKTQTIGIFSGLTRDIDTVSARLEDAQQNATVLAPANSAMRDLERKPWEDAQDYAAFGKSAYEGNDGEDRAHKNLRRFVEAHIVPQSPWQEGEKVKTIAGNEVWYETTDGKTKIQPKGVEVTSIADKVGNGEVWILSGALV